MICAFHLGRPSSAVWDTISTFFLVLLVTRTNKSTPLLRSEKLFPQLGKDPVSLPLALSNHRTPKGVAVTFPQNWKFRNHNTHTSISASAPHHPSYNATATKRWCESRAGQGIDSKVNFEGSSTSLSSSLCWGFDSGSFFCVLQSPPATCPFRSVGGLWTRGVQLICAFQFRRSDLSNPLGEEMVFHDQMGLERSSRPSYNPNKCYLVTKLIALCIVSWVVASIEFKVLLRL